MGTSKLNYALSFYLVGFQNNKGDINKERKGKLGYYVVFFHDLYLKMLVTTPYRNQIPLTKHLGGVVFKPF